MRPSSGPLANWKGIYGVKESPLTRRSAKWQQKEGGQRPFCCLAGLFQNRMNPINLFSYPRFIETGPDPFVSEAGAFVSAEAADQRKFGEVRI